MATAKKLPSGSWRVRVYAGTDETGKRITMSFTAPTKREAERRAAVYAAENRSTNNPFEMTVKTALARYIAAKTPVLSPSTIREYKGMAERHFGSINTKKIYSLTTEDMQRFVSSLTGTVSAKTIANIYGLLTAAVGMFRPDAVFRVTLPRRIRARKVSPTDANVQALFQAASDQMKLCIALAAFGSLRRGEICALRHSDVHGLTVYVHADMVKNSSGQFEYKPFPKTSDSVRIVELPAEVIDLIGDGVDDAFITTTNPDSVTNRFIRLRNRLNLPDIRFHDLRHYYASIGAVLGVPDTYMASFGGWRPGSGVLKNVYQGTIEDASARYKTAMNTHFSGLLSG